MVKAPDQWAGDFFFVVLCPQKTEKVQALNYVWFRISHNFATEVVIVVFECCSRGTTNVLFGYNVKIYNVKL